jgi:hypothetical protein
MSKYKKQGWDSSTIKVHLKIFNIRSLILQLLNPQNPNFQTLIRKLQILKFQVFKFQTLKV